jgi:hypothetical protein
MTEDPRMVSNPLVTRREMLEMSSKAALAGIAAGAVARAAEGRPRIACVVTYWAAPGSHADWIITKLLDGYWWKGAHTPSRVDVVSVYIHQLQESGLGQKVCKSKGIPVFNTVGEALRLGGKELAVDGVVLVGEHGIYHNNLKGQNTGFITTISKGRNTIRAGGSTSRLSGFSSRASVRCRSLTTSISRRVGTKPSGCLTNRVS